MEMWISDGLLRVAVERIDAGRVGFAWDNTKMSLLSLTLREIGYIIIDMNDGNKSEKKERKRNKVAIMPETERNLANMGEQIKLARMRRHYPVQVIADRAGISRATLWKVEKGDPGVAIGIYAKVLKAIGLGNDITLLARNDELGHIIQDSELKGKRMR